jgi:hypothetical protein
MPAKIIRKEDAAKSPVEKKPATAKKAAAAKPVVEKKVEKKRVAKGRPDRPVEATPKEPVKTPKADKVKPLQFRDLWRERGNGIVQYVQMFQTSDDARLYVDYAEDNVPNLITRFSSKMLHTMDEDTKQDVLRAFRRALISHNIDQMSPGEIQTLHGLFSAQSIKNWRDEVASPSEGTLENLATHGIYLLAGSPLADDQNFQPRKTPVVKYSAGDEVYDLFTARDLDRVHNLTDDYERNVQHVDFQDYESLVQLKAFRAMLELWPTTFRHYANKAADVRDLSWTFITSVFRAVVRKDRVEVIVGEDKQGYSFFATTASLQDAVERVFHYFDTLSGDQLETVLKGVGFDRKAVAGMEFEIIQDIQQNPSAFMSSLPGKSIRLMGSGAHFTAAEFLLLAAEAPRGVLFEREDSAGAFDEYRMSVHEMDFRVYYLDNKVYDNGPHRGVASLREHQSNLSTGRAILNIHGIYVDEHNVMHLPISAEAESNFHPETGISPNDDSFFMNSVTFV